jgi:hypothetical protein
MADYYRDVDGYDPPDPQEDDDGRTWQSLDGRRIPFQMLEEKHLLNILRTCRAKVVLASPATLNALEREVLRRGLEPLPDYESYAEAMAISAISSLWTWWKRIASNRTSYTTAFFDAYLTGAAVEQFMLEDGITDPEKHCLMALMGYDRFLQQCSPAAKMRCGEVFKRWTRAMHIDEALGL